MALDAAGEHVGESATEMQRLTEEAEALEGADMRLVQARGELDAANRLVEATKQTVEAANALTSKKARHRIVAYVESYDDIYFWRTVLSEFENDKRYFEVMLPSKINLTRGKKSVLMNFLEGEPLGRDMT